MVLAWAVEGARLWFENYFKQGVRLPEINSREKEEHRMDNDPIGQWLANQTLRDPHAKTSTSKAYDNFNFWRVHEGHGDAMKQIGFTKELKSRGFEKKYSNGCQCFIGLLLRDAASEEND